MAASACLGLWGALLEHRWVMGSMLIMPRLRLLLMGVPGWDSGGWVAGVGLRIAGVVIPGLSVAVWAGQQAFQCSPVIETGMMDWLTLAAFVGSAALDLAAVVGFAGCSRHWTANRAVQDFVVSPMAGLTVWWFLDLLTPAVLSPIICGSLVLLAVALSVDGLLAALRAILGRPATAAPSTYLRALQERLHLNPA